MSSSHYGEIRQPDRKTGVPRGRTGARQLSTVQYSPLTVLISSSTATLVLNFFVCMGFGFVWDLGLLELKMQIYCLSFFILFIYFFVPQPGLLARYLKTDLSKRSQTSQDGKEP